MKSLFNLHKNETAWIIGKGPSLQYLKRKDIGEGIIITINQAILAVESIGFPNPTYSMQKNGGERRKFSLDNLCPDCNYSGQCGDKCGQMVRPTNGASLLLHEHESKYCFPDYPKRHILDWKEFDLPGNVFSLILAIKVAQYMGCNKFNFVCFDAHANNDFRAYIPGEKPRDDELAAGFYRGQTIGINSFVQNIDHKWITPSNDRELKISFGTMINDLIRFDMVLRRSEIKGEMKYIQNPESATKGLNKLLDIIEAQGSDIAILTHQDMFFRRDWINQVRKQLEKLPKSWIVAGVIGKDMKGIFCGKFQDMRIPLYWDTSDIHTFPQEACCIDECVIIVNMKKKFRFDEIMDGFDLYGTLCILQTWKMGGTAWIIDAFCEHFCLRPFTWVPDERFQKNFQWLHDEFEKAKKIDSTALGLPTDAKFETSAA